MGVLHVASGASLNMPGLIMSQITGSIPLSASGLIGYCLTMGRLCDFSFTLYGRKSFTRPTSVGDVDHRPDGILSRSGCVSLSVTARACHSPSSKCVVGLTCTLHPKWSLQIPVSVLRFQSDPVCTRYVPLEACRINCAESCHLLYILFMDKTVPLDILI